MDVNFNIKLKDEIAIILLWIGISGMMDIIINTSMIFPMKNYVYVLFVLCAMYLKLE